MSETTSQLDRDRAFETLVAARVESKKRARDGLPIPKQREARRRKKIEDATRGEMAKVEEMLALAAGRDIEVNHLSADLDEWGGGWPTGIAWHYQHAEYWRHYIARFDDLVEEAACHAFGFRWLIPTHRQLCDEAHMKERRAAIALAGAIAGEMLEDIKSTIEARKRKQEGQDEWIGTPAMIEARLRQPGEAAAVRAASVGSPQRCRD